MVVQASRELQPAEKLVWAVLRALCIGADGAFISAEYLGKRVGLARDTVERHRRTLKELGLLSSTQPRRGTLAAWLCALPCDCMPVGERTLTVDELEQLPRILDKHILAHRPAQRSDTPGDRMRERADELEHASGVSSDAVSPSPDASSGVRSDARGDATFKLTQASAPTPLPARIGAQSGVRSDARLSLPTPLPPAGNEGEVPSPPIPSEGEGNSIASAIGNGRGNGNGASPANGTPASCLDCGEPLVPPQQLRCPRCHEAHARAGFALIKAELEGAKR